MLPTEMVAIGMPPTTDNDNRVLVVKITPNPVLSDPHAINSYYAKMYGIITADDSARHQAFKASAKSISDKWYVDLGTVPWLEYSSKIELNVVCVK